MKQVTNSTSDATFKTQWAQEPLLFQDLGPRKVVADFSGGHLSSDGGALLLRQLDRGLGLLPIGPPRAKITATRSSRSPIWPKIAKIESAYEISGLAGRHLVVRNDQEAACYRLPVAP